MGKYGEIQVNESTGVISHSIPLFDYDAGKMNIPIVLSYSGNGVKVNQDPTWVGLNWNINPGGVITRQVNDLPDELPTTERKYYSEEYLDNLEGAYGVSTTEGGFFTYCQPVTNTPWFSTLMSLKLPHVDTELDIFNYNFLGHSGSFYINKDNEVHLIKYDKEIDIIFSYGLDNTSYFTIVTQDGTEYFFGNQTDPNDPSSKATEISRVVVIDNGSGSQANIPMVQNSFYLTEIKFLNGGHVKFNYENYKPTSDFQYNIGIQESASLSYPPQQPCNRTVKTIYNDVDNLVSLESIENSFNDSKVIFNTVPHGFHNRLRKLNSIVLKNENQTQKKIDLDYLTVANENNLEENRYFLTKVIINGGSNSKISEYNLVYDNPTDIPPKNSFAQDLLGYYNGQTSNITLLAKTNLKYLNENCFFGLANRDAYYEYSKIGSLQKIIYPTGGFTEFEYELPYKGTIDVIENHMLRVNYRNGIEMENSSPYNLINNLNVYGGLYYFPIPVDQSLVITSQKIIKTTIDIHLNGTFSHQVVGRITALNENGQAFTENYTVNAGQYNDVYLRKDVELNLPIGSYVFSFSIILSPQDSHASTNPFAPNLQNFVVGTATIGVPVGTKPDYYPGLRIKRVRTKADGDATENITRYYYNNRFNLNEESYQFHPNLYYRTFIVNNNDSNGTFIDLFNLCTSSVKSTFNTDDQFYTYENVTTSYGGDNFENGGKQSEFYRYSNYFPTFYDYRKNCPGNMMGVFTAEFINESAQAINIGTNDSYQNSVLRQEIIFDTNPSNTNDFRTLRATVYEYKGEVSDVGHNIKNFQPFPNSGSYHNINQMYYLYQTKSYNYRLKSKNTIEYFGENFDEEMVTRELYSYTEDKVSLPSQIETSNSKGETKTVKIYYPSEATTIPELSPTEVSLLNTLQNNKHNVSEIVKIESLLNGTILETKLKSYNSFGGDILTSVIKTSKGDNSLEERVEFLSYNGFGSPSIIRKSDGTKIKYEYNERQQVILKIENYAFNVEIDPDGNPIGEQPLAPPSNQGDCSYHEAYPLSMVTRYIYDSTTYNLVKIIDPRCNTITYHYDNFGRLKEVRDFQNNKLSENEYYYKTQN